MVLLSDFQRGGFCVLGLDYFDDAFFVFHTGCSAVWCGDATGSIQAFGLARKPPCLVFDERESLVDLIHGHQLLLSPSPVRAWHGYKVDWISINTQHALTVTLVVSEAVFDTYDNPVWRVRRAIAILAEEVGHLP